MEVTPRQVEIRKKGFNMTDSVSSYGKIKVGVKTIDDATINLGMYAAANPRLGSKKLIARALADNNVELLREISEYFFRSSGIYKRVCNYFATMYRYDWYLVPEVYDRDKLKVDKLLDDFVKISSFLDNSYIQKVCGDIALNVIKYGAYYGYLIDGKDRIILQELPISYCRCRYHIGNLPAIEFNMRFFDDKFPDVNYRMRVLKMFPKEFQQGYALYKQHKLKPDFPGDALSAGWYLLSPGSVIKFSLTNDDSPLFANVIPSIIDLDNAQDLDRRKQMQKLLKILVQKLPLDKNGDLIFDVDEARDIHNNAVAMLSRAIGVDVLTTFTDVISIDTSDRNSSTTTDDLEKVERTVYNNMGVSRNLFNTDGNLALEKSILNDEGSIRSLLLQFRIFYDMITQSRGSNKKKYNFRLKMLETTQYNYKELSKMYKEQVQIGFSKMLPQVALGHSQSEIINSAYFENEILELSSIMIPPLMSSTLNGEDVLKPKNQSQNTDGESSAGRPEKADNEKSEKTIANNESMN